MYKYIVSAKIYARAAFLYSLENNCISYWYDMLMFTTNIINNEKLNNVFSDIYFPKRKIKVLTNLLKDYITCEFKNFIKLISFNYCLKILPYIFKYFVIFYNEHKHKINVNISTAYKLHKYQLLQIKNIIQEKISGNIKINYKIDKSILAGIIIHINDVVLDGSLLNKIHILKKNIF